jgi:alpha-tubulin suppressor-like RCC1 family protein
LAKRVEGLRGVSVSSGAFGLYLALALTEDGLLYAWGENRQRTILGNPHVERELLLKPVEALRSVRVGSVAATLLGNFTITDTSEVWSWGWDSLAGQPAPLSAIASRRIALCPIRLSRSGASGWMRWPPHLITRWRADDGSVYAWGNSDAAGRGALGLGSPVRDAKRAVPTPQRILALCVSCGL